MAWCNHCGCDHDSSACTRGQCTSLSDSFSWASMRLACIKELGYALMYMDYLHPESAPDYWQPQRHRVEKLCRECASNQGISTVAYWQDFLRRVLEEIENMC